MLYPHHGTEVVGMRTLQAAYAYFFGITGFTGKACRRM